MRQAFGVGLIVSRNNPFPLAKTFVGGQARPFLFPSRASGDESSIDGDGR